MEQNIETNKDIKKYAVEKKVVYSKEWVMAKLDLFL